MGAPSKSTPFTNILDLEKKDWSKKSFFVGLNDGAAILVMANLNSCYDNKIARPLDSWEDKSNDSS